MAAILSNSISADAAYAPWPRAATAKPDPARPGKRRQSHAARNFALYAWSGAVSDSPRGIAYNREAMRLGSSGSLESIMEVAGPVAAGTQDKSPQCFHCGLLVIMVGAAGFELATPCTPCKCATRLRYAPKQELNYSSDFDLCKCFEKKSRNNLDDTRTRQGHHPARPAEPNGAPMPARPKYPAIPYAAPAIRRRSGALLLPDRGRQHPWHHPGDCGRR